MSPVALDSHLSAVSSHIRSVPRQLHCWLWAAVAAWASHVHSTPSRTREIQPKTISEKKMRWSPVLRSISYPYYIMILIGPCAHLYGANPVLREIKKPAGLRQFQPVLELQLDWNVEAVWRKEKQESLLGRQQTRIYHSRKWESFKLPKRAKSTEVRRGRRA